MSALVHCDGPDCNETRDAGELTRRMCTPPWIRVEEGPGVILRDFHNRECLANWANEGRNSWSTWRNMPGDASQNLEARSDSCAGCDQPATHTVGEFDWCDDHGPDGTIATREGEAKR